MSLDLRKWLDTVDEMGELKHVAGADWNLEIGAISALNVRKDENSALLFDAVQDYPKGSRILTCSTSSLERIALTFGLPQKSSAVQLVSAMRGMLPTWEAGFKDFPQQTVESGPVLENVRSGKDVNLFALPVPRWHDKDGGRYIGTGDAIITRDPDSGELNMGTYRIMVHDEKTTALYISPGKHGRMHYEKYFAQGKPCPVAMSFGHHPLVFRTAASEVPSGSEYRFIGAVQGEPVKVVTEEITGLPIPADSEIVAVGWVRPGHTKMEGPFGEWTGYYASKERGAPVVDVERIYFRNEPILLGAPPNRPPNDSTTFNVIKNSAMLWNALDKSGVPDVRGVWMSDVGQQQLVIVSIKQRFHGHVKQAAHLACQNRPAAYHGRYVILVDDDIDPSDIKQVLWALCTRSDPENDIEIIRRAWSTPLDTMIRKPTDKLLNSRAIIDACKPYEWFDEFPEDIKLDPELEKQVIGKWGTILNL
ncbi:MAG: UbiD family decarboxylase [Desulfobacterales bacterium]|nr:UbiD family decarboxylase [Desulfobacterales bacterium]